MSIKDRVKNVPLKDLLINNALLIVVLAMVVFASFNARNFISWNNLNNSVANISLRFIIAVGVSGILIIRGTDLSAGRVVGLSSVVAGGLMQIDGAPNDLFPSIGQQHVLVGFIASILVAMIFGLFNGFIVSILHIPAFIATLGTQIMVYGLNLLLSQSKPIGSFYRIGEDLSLFNRIGSQGILIGNIRIPWLFFFALAIGIFMSILYNSTKHGKYMYAIGGNEQAAEVSGVNVRLVKIKIFVLASILYGIAGFLLTAKTGSTGVNAGFGYELEAIAASTIGGVSTTGGIGTVGGVLLGVTVFELLKTTLQFLGVNPDMVFVVQGLVIIIAVALDVRKTLVKK